MDRDRDLGDGVANSVRTLDQGAHCKCRSAVAEGGEVNILWLVMIVPKMQHPTSHGPVLRFIRSISSSTVGIVAP